MKILKIVLVCLLVAGVLGGAVAGIIKLTDDDAFDKKEISSLAFSVGGLDGTGAYMDTNASIYTKDAFECQGLNITLDFDNMIEYKVYFYDQNNDFVHTTGARTNAFVDTEVPFFAKFARIVVIPTEDDVVSILEVNKYAKQINVSVNREQGFKNFTENLFRVREEGATLDSSTGEISANEDVKNVVSEYINISSYKEALLVRLNGGVMEAGGFRLHFYDLNKTHLGSVDMGSASECFVSSDSFHYYSFSFEMLDFDDTAVFVSYSTYITDPVEFYCR